MVLAVLVAVSPALSGYDSSCISNITAALEIAGSGNIQVTLCSGDYSLPNSSVLTTFQSVSDVAIQGSGATISCTDNAGLAFIGARNITISDVSFLDAVKRGTAPVY